MTVVGVGYRSELPGLFGADGPPAVDCAELVADRYLGVGGFARSWELRALLDSGISLVVHGLSGNVASATGPRRDYLERIRELLDATGAIAYSDHLAFTGTRERSLGHLAPNRFDDELLELAAANIDTIVAATGRRVRLENLASTTTISGSTYTPEEFYLRLLEVSDQWDCLLDLTNVWINSRNRPLDPTAFIDAIPPHRVGYVHLAGGRQLHGEWTDTHSEPVHDEAFELLAHLLERCSPEVVMIERDSNWAGAEEQLRADVARTRALIEACAHGPSDLEGRVRPRPVSVRHERRDVVAVGREIGAKAEPHAAGHDRDGTFVVEGWEAIRSLRYGAVAVPTELGGEGADLETVCRAQAAMARGCANTALAIAMHQHNVLSMAWRWRLGDDSVEETLTRVAGEGLLLSSSGSADLTRTGVTAVPVDGGVRVTGQKAYCSGVPGADLILTAAAIADDPGQVVNVLVPARSAGVLVLDNWDAMGMRASGSNGVRFDDVFVPEAGVLWRRRLRIDPFLRGTTSVARGTNSVPGGTGTTSDLVDAPIRPDATVRHLRHDGGNRSTRVPGLQMALTVIASVYLGAADGVRQRAVALIAGTERSRDPARQRLVGLMTHEVSSAWWALEELVRRTDDDALGTEEHFVLTMLAKRQIVLHSIATAEHAMELIGGAAYARNLPFEQALRDIQAGVTHPLSPEATLLEVGRSELDRAVASPS